MRKTITDAVGLRQLQCREQVDRILACICFWLDLVTHRRLDGLVDQAMGRIERGGGRLRNVGDARAPQSTLVAFRHTREVKTVECDPPGCNLAARPRKTHRGKTEGRLAGARLSDETHDLATPQCQANTIDDGVPLIIREALNMDVLHFEENVALFSLDLLSAHRATHLSCAGTNRR